eukprot:Gb_12880 [translate_table: standard]
MIVWKQTIFSASYQMHMEAENAQEPEQEQEVWSWGAGTDGQLATGRLQDGWLPQSVPALASLPVSWIACGGAHALALVRGGQVVSWGRGKSGQLGHGDCESSLQPKLVKFFEDTVIRGVAAGWSHSSFVSEGAELFTCGDGTFGQLGHGHFESQCFPSKVEAFVSKHVFMVACGMRHTLVLLKAGTSETSVFAFGSARRGQLGVSTSRQDCNDPTSARTEASRCNVPTSVKEFDVHNVALVCANGDHSAALTDNGHLYVWGRGFGGIADIVFPKLATSTLSFCQVALGWNHGMVLTDDGETYIWGGNHHGKLGSCKENMAKADSLLLDRSVSTSDIFKGEDDNWLALRRISSLEGIKIKQIAAGAEHSSVVLENGAVMTWGWGEHGQLGLGSTSDEQCPQTVPIDVPFGARNKSLVYCGSGFTFTIRCST